MGPLALAPHLLVADELGHPMGFYMKFAMGSWSILGVMLEMGHESPCSTESMAPTL